MPKTELNRFGMYNAKGGARVRALVLRVEKNVASGKYSRKTAVAQLQKYMKRIGMAHAEVTDTDVRDQIASHLDRSFQAAGFETLSIYEDL